MTDEIELITESDLNQIRDNVEAKFWRRIKPKLDGYCSKTGRKHESSDFTLKWYSDWRITRSLIRRLGRYKRCRRCGAKISEQDYEMARKLEHLKESVIEELQQTSQGETSE